MADLSHWLAKLRDTTARLGRQFMARTFGEYVHTEHWHGVTAAVYRWRGETVYVFLDYKQPEVGGARE